MINPDRYDEIRRARVPSQQAITIPTFVPNPSEEDYRRGRIERFFTRRANHRNGLIFEIDRQQQSVLRGTSSYIVTSLDWKIVGTVDEIKRANNKSLNLASKEIPNIKLYLPNLIQFARIEES